MSDLSDRVDSGLTLYRNSCRASAGAWLACRRRASRFRQRDVAVRSGLPLAAVRRIERGDPVDLDDLDRYMRLTSSPP